MTTTIAPTRTRDALVDSVRAALDACPSIDATTIVVDVLPGGVRLTGRLPSRDQRDVAVIAALRVHGVTAIADCLDVPQPRFGHV